MKLTLFYYAILLHLLSASLSSSALAFGTKEPHWFGLGGGAWIGNGLAPSLSFEGGRLWSDAVGVGAFLLAPTTSKNGRADLLALGTIDFFNQNIGIQYSALIGIAKVEDGYPFTTGLKAGYARAFSKHWYWGASAASVWINRNPDTLVGLLQGEVQFRY